MKTNNTDLLGHEYEAFKLFIQHLSQNINLASLGRVTQDLNAKEYLGLSFEYANKKYLFRQAKITPTKLGGFITLWRRDLATQKTIPWNEHDCIDGIVVATQMGENTGYFLFGRNALLEHGILSTEKEEGKRAMRVYPPWVQLVAKQAIQTQNWQTAHFVALKNCADFAKKAHDFLS